MCGSWTGLSTSRITASAPRSTSWMKTCLTFLLPGSIWGSKSTRQCNRNITGQEACYGKCATNIRNKINIRSRHFSSTFFLSLSQTEEHPLHLQHPVGGFHLESFYRPFPDGQKHLVLCGQPLFQIPVLLPRIQHHNQVSVPHLFKAETAALAFSCQQDATSETPTVRQGHSESSFVCGSAGGSLQVGGYSRMKHSKERKEVY